MVRLRVSWPFSLSSAPTVGNPCRPLQPESLLGLEPIESGREAEDAHEGAGRLLIAGGNGAPLFQPRPEPLDVVAIGVDPLRAGDLFLVALGGDRRASAQAPDVLAKGVTAQASISHHPLRHT